MSIKEALDAYRDPQLVAKEEQENQQRRAGGFGKAVESALQVTQQMQLARETGAAVGNENRNIAKGKVGIEKSQKRRELDKRVEEKQRELDDWARDQYEDLDDMYDNGL